MKTIHFQLFLASKRHSATEEKVEVRALDCYTVKYLKNSIKPEYSAEFKKLYIDNKEYFDEENIESSHFKAGKNSFLLHLDDEIHIKFNCLNYFTDSILEIVIPTNEKITFQQLIRRLSDQYNFDFDGEVFVDDFDSEIQNKEQAVIWNKNYSIKNHTTLALKIKNNNNQIRIETINEEEKKEDSDENEQKQVLEKMLEIVEKEIGPLISRKEKIEQYDKLKLRLKDNVCTLMFLGGVCVGKTTLINKILSSFLKSPNRLEILKSHENENTGFIWVLKHGDKLRIVYDQKPPEEFESIDDDKFTKRMKELSKIQEKEKNNKIIEVQFPFMPEKLKLIDFPGYSNIEIYEAIRSFVQMSEFSHFFILNDCQNPSKEMEYEKKFLKEFASMIDKKKKKDIDFFLVYTKKDKYFLEEDKKQLKKRHKYLIRKVLNMKKMNLSIKNVFVMDLKEPMNSSGFLKILQQIDQMIKTTPLYKFNYFLNELHALFASEKENFLSECLDVENPQKKLQDNLTKMRNSKEMILENFKNR